MSLRPRALPAGFVAPCLPTSAAQPPSGDAWLHEIKHDGFRVIARKNGHRVKLYSRPGNDLTPRFPRIGEALSSCGREEEEDHEPCGSSDIDTRDRRQCADGDAGNSALRA